MTKVAISLDDRAFAEIRHFRLQANAAQREIRVHEVFVRPEDRLPSSGIIDARDACQRAFALKRRLRRPRLTADDHLILVTLANVFDHNDDEYFCVSNLDYRDLRKRCPGVGILSLYYLDSEKPSMFFKKARRRREWKRLSARGRERVLSDSILLNLLCALSSQLTGLSAHDAPRECIMDYCDDPSEILRSLRGGFSYDAHCAKRLARSARGRALVAIARRLTARPFHSQPPRIFVSYSRVDNKRASRLWADLTERGHDVFLDKAKIQGGVKWEREIKRRLRSSEFVILCLSKAALNREGFFEVERKEAIRVARSKGTDFLIPVRLGRCEIPPELERLNCVDMFPDWEAGVDRISSSVAGYRV